MVKSWTKSQRTLSQNPNRGKRHGLRASLPKSSRIAPSDVKVYYVDTMPTEVSRAQYARALAQLRRV